jgi:hypothetical protein
VLDSEESIAALSATTTTPPVAVWAPEAPAAELRNRLYYGSRTV